MQAESLSYPIGKYVRPSQTSPEIIQQWIADIEELPKKLRTLTAQLSEAQSDIPYRPDGWTSRQVVHHLADSHINSFVRFKLVMTETNPVIRPYQEADWAKTPDASSPTPLEISLQLLDALHIRWTILLKSMIASDWQRTYFHPEYPQALTLEFALGLYAWHGKHHTAHIQSVIDNLAKK